MKVNSFFTCFLILLVFLCSCKNSKTGTTSYDTTASSPEVKAVVLNGDSLHYIDLGKGDPVIFIHGGLGDYRGFGAQRDTFSKNHRVIVYSRRYAFPDKQPIKDSLNYTIDPHVKDLVEFIKVLNLGRVHLVGHSYGAVVALQTTLGHPELVRSLTLGEPPYPSLLQNIPGEDTIWENFMSKFKNPSAEAFKKGDNEKAVEIFINGVMEDSSFFSHIPPEFREAMMVNSPELRAIVLTKDPYPDVACDQLQKIKVPVLLVGGDRSPAALKATTNQLDRCLDGNELAILPNASHGLQNENPSEFNKIVLRFIDRH
jgi:pimeloyl-ACP methyl ester carboxylesterase